PLCSVYVRNLEERVKPEILKETLRAIFSEYGNVIDIVAKTNLKAKGQAFVVFDKPESAQAAIEDVQGFEVFDKPMQVALARTRSDATVAKTGNEEEFEAHKRHRMAEKAGLKATGPAPAAVVPDEYLPPNKILFVQNLPDDFDVEALTNIFGRFEGFREVRLVPGRRGIAFVEYDSEAGAITAKENTAGMALKGGEKTMKVTYQRQ
ncbi:RNA-binding domain-containing protein, partial [Coniochaeta ligniaria NRRL 30616]